MIKKMTEVPFFFSEDFGRSEKTENINLSHYHIARTSLPRANNSSANSVMDLDWLLAQPLLPFIVQMLPSHALYKTIMYHGSEDCLEIIEHIKGKKLREFFDYDLWVPSSEKGSEDLSVMRFLQWIELWSEISPEFAAERTMELEEEVLIGLFSAIFEIFPEGLVELTDLMKDELWCTPDKRFYVRVKDSSLEGQIDKILSFVHTLYATDFVFAGAIFAHAAMLNREESMEYGLKWRQTRLSEQGFVTRDEALSTLTLKSPEYFKKVLEDTKKKEKDRQKVKSSSVLDDFEDTEEIKEEIGRYLENLDATEALPILKAGLGDSTLKQLAGGERVSLITLYADEEFQEELTEALYTQTKKIIARHTLISSPVKEIENETLLIEKVLGSMADDEALNEALFSLKSRISRLANIVATGFGDKALFDLQTSESALLLTRGIINLGLEIALLAPESEWHFYKNTLENKAKNPEDEISKAYFILNSVGPEFVFQMGWSAAHTPGKIFVEKVFQIPYKRTLNLIPYFKKSFLKFTEIFDTYEMTGIDTILGTVPQYPQFLGTNDKTALSQARFIETLNDLEQMRDFMKHVSEKFSLMSIENKTDGL